MRCRAITHRRLWWQHWRASFCLFVWLPLRLTCIRYEIVAKVRAQWYLWCLIKGLDIQLADWHVRNVALFIGCPLHETKFLHVIIHLPGIGISDKFSTATSLVWSGSRGSYKTLENYRYWTCDGLICKYIFSYKDGPSFPYKFTGQLTWDVYTLLMPRRHSHCYSTEQVRESTLDLHSFSYWTIGDKILPQAVSNSTMYPLCKMSGCSAQESLRI